MSQSQNDCRCEAKACGCTSITAERCRCGNGCRCERECRCDGCTSGACSGRR
ncbi:MAG TPA: hypothetical protein VIL20_16810 [Sandaracinaceae bacterium]